MAAANILWATTTCRGRNNSSTPLYNPTSEVLVSSPSTDEETEVQGRNVCRSHSQSVAEPGSELQEAGLRAGLQIPVPSCLRSRPAWHGTQQCRGNNSPGGAQR